MRKSRIKFWILTLIVAFVMYIAEGFVAKLNVEKTPLYVYAPKDMEEAFESALKLSELKGAYEITMTDDISKANIVVEMGKEFESGYTKLAYSPFVVAYSYEGKNIKTMIKNGLLQEAFHNNSYYEIYFNKIVEEVIEEGNWETFGVKDLGKIKVIYPAPGTTYYHDYYDFMLVTVNGGTYPKTETDLKLAMEQIERFESSNYTEAVTDFAEKYNRTGGFAENTLYLIPEREADSLSRNQNKYGRLFYPTVTVNANYYIKADELGQKLVAFFGVESFWESDFYCNIANIRYRNDEDNTINTFSNGLAGTRDEYNVLHLKADRLRP